MKNFWEKIKNFFSRIWSGLTTVGRIILGLIILAAIILISFAFSKNSDEEKQQNNPEVAQVYEPSIGAPLPPDVNTEASGSVGGTSTTEPSSEVPTTNFVAPNAGVDENQPIKYDNSSLKFTATLPAYSQVIEQAEGVKFTSSNGALHYIVSVNSAGTESLESIESQLKNSPSTSNISYANLGSIKTLKFNNQEYGSGVAFIANGKIYYLLGNSKYFSDFKLL